MEYCRYDICEAYYLYLSEYHSGQWSKDYKRLSKMNKYFKPSINLCYENLTDLGRAVYDNLVKER